MARRWALVFWAAVLSLAFTLSCGEGPDAVTTFDVGGDTIHRLALPEGEQLITNAYLIESEGRVLVDTGVQTSTDELDAALEGLGLGRGDIDLVVVTHGHPDHAGGAAHLQDVWNTPVFIGHPDRAIVDEGINPELTVQSPEGWVVLHLINHDPIPPVALAVSVDRETDLAPYGVTGTLVPTPGHTPGSVAVVLEGGAAFIGDMARTDDTSEGSTMRDHVFGDDLEADRANMQMLLNRGATQFFPGHGAPVGTEAVRAWLGS